MTPQQINQTKDWIYITGLLTMLVMALLPLVDINEMWMRWAYTAGAATTLIVRLTQRYKGKNLRLRRLYILSTMATVLYCTSAALTFLSTGTGDWIALLMAGALMQTYTSYMTDRTMRSAGEKDI